MTILDKFDITFPEHLANEPMFDKYKNVTSDDLKYDSVPVFCLGLFEDWIDNLIENVSIPATNPARPFEALVPSYGVCDSPEQIIEIFGEALEASPRNFLINATVVKKDDEPATGGWRWHKWGAYYGTKEPRCEYLYDEDDSITQACYFSINEIAPNRARCIECFDGWVRDDAKGFGLVLCHTCHGEGSYVVS